MNIAVKGSADRVKELSEVLTSANLKFTVLESTKNLNQAAFDVIFDLNFDDNDESLSDYMLCTNESTFMLSCVKIQLEAVIPRNLRNRIIGINALPGFLRREMLEYCTVQDDEKAENLIKRLGWKGGNRTSSRLGLVSPRVICMIINEAYFTIQEGTADAKDIDLGMKLGTSYPLGPMEWADKIGIQNVYETLSALYRDTGDERYKICSLLRTKYLNTVNS